MKRVVFVIGLLLASIAAADVVVTLNDGSTLQGTFKRTPDGYLVTTVDGAEHLVPFDQVKGFKTVNGASNPQMGGTALDSLRRATANLNDLSQIISRYKTFIAQNPGSPAAADAEKDLAQWQDRADKKLVKAGADWVTPEQLTQLKAASRETATRTVPMISGGKLAEASAEIDKGLAIAPTDADLLYLKGIILFKQAQVAPARNAFRAAVPSAPQHGPLHNNLAVTLAKGRDTIPALAEFEKAMGALPANQTILDNVAETLHTLTPASQKNEVVRRVVELFKSQDAALQQKMAASGLYRWGSKWIAKAEYDAIQAKVKEQKDRLDAIKKQFEENKKRLLQIDEQMRNNVRRMAQLTENNIVMDAKGQPVQVPPPAEYFDKQREQAQLTTERAQKINDEKSLDRAYHEQSAKAIQGTYSGVLTLFEADALPSTPAPVSTTPVAAKPGASALTPRQRPAARDVAAPATPR